MSNDPFCDPSDVETALLRPLTTLEAQYCPGLIDQASALLRTAAPSIDARIAANSVDPTDLTSVSATTTRSVVAGIVKRYLVNPTGIATQTMTEGPFSHSTAFALRAEKEIRGALQVTVYDLNVLFPNRKRARVGSFRIHPNLAPRPVGKYGPFNGPDQMIAAVVEWSPVNPAIQQELEIAAGLLLQGVSVPDGQQINL